MDHARPQHPQQIKSSTIWHRECGDESMEKKPTDVFVSPTQDGKWPIRRDRSPSRPRAWTSSFYQPKFEGRFYSPHLPRDDHSFYKSRFSYQRYNHLKPQPYFDRRNHSHPKLHHSVVREKEREKEKGCNEWWEGADRSLPPKQNATRPFLPRSNSSRDKDMHSIYQNDRNQGRERDHRRSKSKEREPSREREPPLTTSQTATRDRAIRQKRREIDEVYYQDCEMFGLVTKKLIEKDPSLEHLIQSSLQENLRDIGKRCVEAMERFIEDYDSRESLH